MEDFTLQLRCNVCDEVLVAHWRVDTAGVFAHVDPCPKCKAAQQSRAADDCPRGGSHVYKWDGTLPTEEMIECEKCGHRR